MKYPLTNGEYTLVDRADLKKMEGYKWAKITPVDGQRRLNLISYAATQRYRGGKKHIFLHRHLLDAPDGMFVDHKNGNGLDNRRKNIRLCDRFQNQWNSPKKRGYAGKPCVTKYKGVFIRRGYIGCEIMRRGKLYRLGYFPTQEKARDVYQAKAKELDGEFFYVAPSR